MAKRYFFSAIFIIAAMILYAEPSAQRYVFSDEEVLVPAAYPAGVELYPAVYGTFAELYPKAQYASIDFYNNTYTLTGITGNALLIPLSYDMTVKLNSRNEVEITYANIYQYDAKTKKWTGVKAFGLYDYKKAVANIQAKIQAIATDSAAYDRAEKAAMADVVFVYAILDTMTDLAFKDFIEKYAKGSIFVMEGAVSDVKEYGESINGVPYKYVVTMNRSIISDDTTYGFKSRTIYSRIYTNRDDVIRLSKTAVTKFSAQLVTATKNLGGDLILYLATGE